MSSTSTTTKSGAIITGAASGVGLALTKHLLNQGWRVVMMDINLEGQKIAEELGEDVFWLNVNIATWTDVVKAFTKAFEWHQKIAFLAANAGISSDMTLPYGILSPDLDELSKPPIPVIDVNLLGTSYCIKVFLHFMQKKENHDTEMNVKGRIVVTSSEAGLYALPLDPLYCASKHGLVGLVRSLGPAYLSAFGITVNTISPGYIPTPLVASLIPITPIEYATPMTTILNAFDRLLASDQSGQVLEASGEHLHLRPQPEYLDDVSKWVWDDAPAFWTAAFTKMATGE